MGKNKDRLTANNLDLTAILRGINNLPPAGGEDLQSTAEAQTTAVEELMKMVNRKIAMNNGEGQYVWKKYDAPHFTLKFSVTNSSSPYNLRVDCVEVDLTKVDASWFIGIKGVWNGNGYYEFPNTTTLRIFDGNNAYNFTSTWNASTQSFTVTSSTGIGNTSQFADYVADGQFVDYVVGTAVDAYPNGGELDGYWYELVKESVDLLTLTEFTKIAVDNFTLSSRTISTSVSISHSLNEAPRAAILMSPMRNYVSGDIYWAVYVKPNETTSGGSAVVRGNISSTVFPFIGEGHGLANSYVTASKIQVLNNSNYYYTAGIEYILITMA